MRLKSIFCVITAIVLTGTGGSIWADGNRYNKERLYHSEISAAQAWQEMKNNRQRHHWKRKHERKAVLIDVRSMEEYAAGHPIGGYNVPYPRVCTGCDPQPEATFYWEVYNIVHGDTDRLIMTLCRTGSRSVAGGNILANPSAYGIDGPAFTNVRNIWHGFVGKQKYPINKSDGTVPTDANGKPIKLDLNNNGVIDDDTADVFAEVKDANPDKDGWRNFQQLPWTTAIHRRYAFQRNVWQYYNLNLTPVQ